MRKFYENWLMLDPDSLVTNNEIKLTITIAELQSASIIDIYQSIKVPDTKDFPIEDFFRTPFTHHVRIIEGVKELSARYYYIHRTAEENLPIRMLEKLIANDAYVQ